MRSAAVLLAAGALLAALAGVGVSTAAAAASACVGAEARAPRHRCSNVARTISPKKGGLGLVPASTGCKLTKQQPEPVCTFGASARRAKAHVALLGDSHALHWRAAVDVVAEARRWRGYSVTTAGCPFSAAVEYLPPGLREPCVEWYAEVRAWLRRHPEISTVFVSQKSDTPVAAPGRTEAQIKTAGFRRAWTTLPRTVRRVVVLRDVPDPADTTFDCVKDAVRVGTPRLGLACPTPRAIALRPDIAAAAARGLRSPRYRSIDLSSLFCTPADCYPVIGGLQVYADVLGHITAAYMTTVGPYLLRRLAG